MQLYADGLTIVRYARSRPARLWQRSNYRAARGEVAAAMCDQCGSFQRAIGGWHHRLALGRPAHYAQPWCGSTGPMFPLSKGLVGVIIEPTQHRRGFCVGSQPALAPSTRLACCFEHASYAATPARITELDSELRPGVHTGEGHFRLRRRPRLTSARGERSGLEVRSLRLPERASTAAGAAPSPESASHGAARRPHSVAGH
jgi:hypothetical protein